MPQQTRSIGWQFGMSAFWFATAMKWFAILIGLNLIVEPMVPGGDKGMYWGRVVGIGAAWAMIGPALFGWLSGVFRERIGSWRPWLAVGSVLTSLALFFLSDPKNYLVIVFAYLLLQVSDDLATGPYSAILPSLVPEEQRGRASGIMSLVQFAAQIVAGITAIALGSLRLLFLSIAAINLVCAVITLATVREELAPRSKTKQTFLQAWTSPWKIPDFTWCWFTRFLNALGFYVIVTYLSYYLLDSVRVYQLFGRDLGGGGKPEDRAQHAVFLVALLISFLAGIGAVIGGRLSDKIGRKRVIYAAGTTMAVALPALAFFHQFTLIVLLAMPFGLAYGAYDSAGWALVSDVLPDPEEFAKDMGLWQSSIAAPQIVSGLVVGPIIDALNRWQFGAGYNFVFLFAAVAYLFSTVLVKKIRGST
jgi:MFS family permease